MKRVILQCVSVLLSFVLLSVPGISFADERPYLFFEQPEDAILYFVQSVAAADFESALRATHAQSSAEAYDLEKALNDRGALMFDMPMPFPSLEYASYAALNRWGQKEELKKQLYAMLLSLLVDPALCDARPRVVSETGIVIDDQTNITLPEYIAALNPARLEDLKIEYIARWEPSENRSEAVREMIEEKGRIFGFSDEVYFVVIYSFEGKPYSNTYTVARYPQGWQIEMIWMAAIGADAAGMVELADERGIAYWREQWGAVIIYEADQ